MLNEAKDALDKIIKKSRVHFYKPFQIAEILFHYRNQLAQIDIENVNTYRNLSKRWRDTVSTRLVGRVSTSSQKFQDNLFDENALPPRLLKVLAEYNHTNNGVIEIYIYYQFKNRLQDIIDAYLYLNSSTITRFSLREFLNYFEARSGLKRSVDKAFEIVVYALFSTLVRELKATVSLSLNNPDAGILNDFNDFIHYVLGFPENSKELSVPASMFRSGVTNAADRGLDIVTNYGPVIQVKHLSLDESLGEEIVEGMAVNDIVIVCKTAEAQVIKSLLNQVGLGIRGIITQANLEDWYSLCLGKYPIRMGELLLKDLAFEFTQEFPMIGELNSFLLERNYAIEKLDKKFHL